MTIGLRLLTAIGTGTTVALCAAATLRSIVRASKPADLAPADAALVFGAGIWSGTPSLTMRRRVETAARIYHAGLAPVILCSGGYSQGLSEARLMRSLLVEGGVPAEAVIPDDSGTSTRLALQAARHFGRGRWRHVIAVSSPYHLHRVAHEARRQGLSVSTYPATRGGAATWRHLAYDMRQQLRETLATWQYAATAPAIRTLRRAHASLPVRVVRHARARLLFLVRDADAVAHTSETITHDIKRGVAGFSEAHAVLTPASGLHWPVQGSLGDRFGMRYGRLHAGLDVRAPYGSPVVAAAGGDVLSAGWRAAYGNVVVVHHGGGLASVYAHLAGIVVDEGQPVAQGQRLGFVGTTGRASGPHLHFEVRVHGSPVEPLAYLPPHDEAQVPPTEGQHNAVWAESLYFRGFDPKKPRRVLEQRHLEELAQRLTDNGIRYAYLFAGPFGQDGALPDYAFSPTAMASAARLRALAPDIVWLPWVGGLQHATVHLDDPRWVARAIADTARLIEVLGVPGVHVDFELVLPDCTYVLKEKGLAQTTAGLEEYATWHIDFHAALRARLPDAFLATVIPSTADAVRPWKRKHSPDEAATLAGIVDQVALMYYDTSIDNAQTFEAGLVQQLQHIAAWKARPAASETQCLIGVGTFVNARPLRGYRHLHVERLDRHIPALVRAIDAVQADVRLVDGLAVYCDWTTRERDWRVLGRMWAHTANR